MDQELGQMLMGVTMAIIFITMMYYAGTHFEEISEFNDKMDAFFAKLFKGKKNQSKQ